VKGLLTVVIPVLNEERRIIRTINSVQKLGANCFVVDSGSADNTLKVAKDMGCKVYQGQWKTFGEKLNWAFDNNPYKTPWVMRLDADEYMTDGLIDEIRRVLPSVDENVSGFLINRGVEFLGRLIRHGGMYPLWDLRLFRAGKVYYERKRLTDEYAVPIEGKVEKLKNEFIDVKDEGLLEWSRKHINVADRERKWVLLVDEQDQKIVLDKQKDKRSKRSFYYKMPLFFRVFVYWGYRYFIKLGFLDGIDGFIFHFLQGFWYRFLIDAMIFEAQKGIVSKEKLREEYERYIC